MKAVILARGGSKGVPHKNIKLLGGKPLLAYPILVAQESKYITDIYVSTDDEEIANVASILGCTVIARPQEISEDNSPEIYAFRHYVTTTKNYEDVVHLRATTPLIEVDIIDKAIEFFKENEHECTALRSAHQVSESIYKFFKKEGKYWAGFFPELEGEYYNMPRQNFPENYLPNGYIDIIRPIIFMNKNSLHGNKILAFITDFAPEVDSMADFKFLETYYQQNKNKDA